MPPLQEEEGSSCTNNSAVQGCFIPESRGFYPQSRDFYPQLSLSFHVFKSKQLYEIVFLENDENSIAILLHHIALQAWFHVCR